MEYHRLGAYQEQKFLTVLETGKFKIKVPADLVLGESPLPGSWMALFSLYPDVM